jgi:hypothetical protein
MTDSPTSSQIAERRKELAPIHDAFQEFSRQVFAAGALDEKTKQPRCGPAAPTRTRPWRSRPPLTRTPREPPDRGRQPQPGFHGGDAPGSFVSNRWIQPQPAIETKPPTIVP